MKAAIFNHPFYDFYISPKRLQPGILDYLQKIIEPYQSIKFDVVKKLKKQSELPCELLYLKNYLIDDLSEYSFFNQYYLFGSTGNFNHKLFTGFLPDVIIITSFAFCYFKGFADMTAYLKEKYKLPVICGGPGPSADPLYYLNHSLCDYVVKGPAELSLKQLLYCLSSGDLYPKIRNVYHKNNYNPVIELDTKYDFKPFVNVKKDKYFNIQLQITRGCIKKCKYCSVNICSGSLFLEYDEYDVINMLPDLPGKVHINFEDDNITYNKDKFIKLLDLINKKYDNVSFSAENGIDFTTLDNNMINKLISSGFKQFNLSITSIEPYILKSTGRNYNKSGFMSVYEELSKRNAQIIVYFIPGLPGDSVKNIFATIIFLSGLNVIIGMSNFYPVPGTGIVDSIEKPIIPVYAKGSSFYEWSNINTKKLITLFVLTRFINFIKRIDINEWYQLKTVYLKNRQIKCSPENRKFLSMAAVMYSIKKKTVFAVSKKEDRYVLIKRKLDSKITGDFFCLLYKGHEIAVKDKNKFNITFWRRIWKNIFL